LNRHEASKDGEATDSSDIRHRIEALRLALISGLRNEPAAGRRPGGYARAGGHTPAPGGSTGIRPATRIGIEEIENSREIICDHGKCLLVEREIDGSLGISSLNDTRLLETYRDLMAAGPEASPGPGGGPEAGVIFLDLETTGFCATPLFLAGVLIHRGGKLRVVQMLARDYSEERCLIALLDDLLADCGVCVTFNGKSFDIPYLKERAKYHRVRLRSGPQHFDLLHHARRRWKHKLPDCRLLTLEWFILGRRRMGDVGGWEVPCIYHEFVHTKDASRLKQVLRHNLMDVLSMAELLVSLAEA
jgi:uncharacterized protein YprB with RNaseH-like and TPR domain